MLIPGLDRDAGTRSEMGDNLTRKWIESPQTDADLAESVDVGHCRGAFSRRQNEYCHVCKIPISVGLSHALAPTVQFNLKCSHGWFGCLKKGTHTPIGSRTGGVLPRNGEQVGYTKSIDCNLASAGELPLICSVMEIDVLCQVLPRKLKRETCFSCRDAKLAARKVALRFTEPDLRNYRNGSCFHATNISPLSGYDYGKTKKVKIIKDVLL